MVAAQAYSIKSILIFNKFDIYKKNELKSLNEIINIYKKIGYQCLTFSTKDGLNLEILKRSIQGKTIMLGGHSGLENINSQCIKPIIKP
ncbi:MAG: hypothetical protein CM15mP129_00540 [Chloroflexota bacterium]|nr:MAG: hypothetical protein CM15mP129_00540 [Chloroflexota bacterium]